MKHHSANSKATTTPDHHPVPSLPPAAHPCNMPLPTLPLACYQKACTDGGREGEIYKGRKEWKRDGFKGGIMDERVKMEGRKKAGRKE